MREWVDVFETCVNCPEFQERFRIPGVSHHDRECRFAYEHHREVERRTREYDKQLTNLGWGYMDPDVLQEVLDEQTNEWEPPAESQERVTKAIRQILRGPDEDEGGSDTAEKEESDEEDPESEDEEEKDRWPW